MKMKMVRIQKVYEEIIELQGWEDDPGFERDSKIRTLRNKFSALMEKKMCCDLKQFNNGGHEISIFEVPIVRNILIASLDKSTLVSKWFDGRVNLDSSEVTIKLYEELSKLVNDAQVETDEVTIKEWLTSLDAATDYSNAKMTSKIKELLEEMRAAAKPINHTIQYGEIILTDNDGSRDFGYSQFVFEEPIDISEMSINEIMEYAGAERDYWEVLYHIIGALITNVREKSHHDILIYAEFKAIMDEGGERTARDIAGSEQMIASAYLQRFRNIYEYLKLNPTIVDEIESKAGTKDLLKFFDVTGEMLKDNTKQ